MPAKIVVQLVVNGKWEWNAEAPIEIQARRRMSAEELKRIAAAAVEVVQELMAAPERPALREDDRKRKR